MDTELVLGIVAAWFAASIPLGAVLGRMLRAKPPLQPVRHSSGTFAA